MQALACRANASLPQSAVPNKPQRLADNAFHYNPINSRTYFTGGLPYEIT